MSQEGRKTYAAFAGTVQVAEGTLRDVALVVRERSVDPRRPLRIFDDTTGEVVQVDLHGTAEQVVARLPADTDPEAEAGAGAMARGPGRPKLGVVSKEVTLLPRHWAWLGAQRGSVSATLRRLIDEARHMHEERDATRRAQDAAYRFISVIVGDDAAYEEAIRALYRGDAARFERETEPWAADVRAHCRKLAAAAFRSPVSPTESSPSHGQASGTKQR
jgi:hypothetical protein